MTTLIGEGRRRGDPLLSETNVVDDRWHRIGFVWDGLYRTLYVGGDIVATDTAPQASLSGNEGGMTIGAAVDQKAGTFWSGLIDDVRVYDRVVVP